MNDKKKEIVECAVLIYGVPVKIKNKFKAKCAELGITMKDAIVKFMEDF